MISNGVNHITSRGNEKKAVFKIAEAVEKYGYTLRAVADWVLGQFSAKRA